MRTPIKSLTLMTIAAVLHAVSMSASTPAITVTPGLTILSVSQKLQYTATVSGLSSTAVKWEVNDVIGGNATVGTISSSGLYQAPATLVTSGEEMTITALGSDGKTKGIVKVEIGPAGPSISAITPNPIAPGKYTVIIHGTTFKSGAIVRNGSLRLSATYVSATEVTATGQQATLATGSFQVANPNTAWGPPVSVPFKTNGAIPVISPKTIYVHLGNGQLFTAPGATYWTTTAGSVSQAGVFLAPATMPASSVVTVTATGPGGSATAKITLASGAEPVISPKTATVAITQKQQFTSSGAISWSAKYGTITSAGLYTAPKVWPASGSDEISVTGIHGSTSENIVVTPPIPVITSVGTLGHIPLGVFSVVVSGTNFSPASVAAIRGMTLPTTYSNGQLIVSGFFNKPGAATLTVINAKLNSLPFPVQIGLAAPKVTPAAARRFLEQAAFGPSPNDAEQVQASGFAGWLASQFAMPQQSNYNSATANNLGMPKQFMTNAVEQPDQLRQRVAFALSQIFVTSQDELTNGNEVAYQNMLLADAFTNYRTIMTDVTLSPGMGEYLNIANNAKANPATGSLANENFAREMMQLFTLGTVLLNQDGTVQVDSNNIPIPTYSQFTVTEFARVYTGWTYAPAAGKSIQWGGGMSNFNQMVPYTAQHDYGSKQLLNGYVAPADTSPKVDVENAINNIFNHPNIGPFVGTLLIQHLVKSNPSPAYVSRVAAAFNNNGSGVRGDMKAVISAILLDPEARANDQGGDDQPTDGHLQEPALFIAGMIRAFGGQMNDSNYYQWDLANLGQDLFSSPSVFNYYAPNYGVPGTSLLGGEFQIDSPNNAVLRANEVSTLFSHSTDPVVTYGPGTTVNLAPYLFLAQNPTDLVNALDFTLTHGTMPAAMKEAIVTAVAGETGGSLRQVERACYLILTSSYYNVWH
jgi:uncharacterized protein (DUF1800 family)